jgi:hypothetical protein
MWGRPSMIIMQWFGRWCSPPARTAPLMAHHGQHSAHLRGHGSD